MSDQINNPSHYNQGKIKPIEVIEDWKLGFCEATVIKYIARAKHKGEELQDLQKARWYLDRRIKNMNQGEVEITKCSEWECPMCFAKGNSVSFARSGLSIIWCETCGYRPKRG